MASPQVLAIEDLLSPIPGDLATGRDLRDETSGQSAFFELRSCRNQASAGERQVENQSFTGETDQDRERAKRDTILQIDKNWEKVFTLGEKALSETTKDLDIATWLIEASLRIYGFAGLRDGCKVAAGLIQQYWDEIFPRPDEDDDAASIAATLSGLSGRGGASPLLGPIRRIELSDSDAGPFTYSCVLSPTIGSDGVTRTAEHVAQALRESDRAFIGDLADDLRDALEAIQALEQALDHRLGREAPSFSSIRAELSGIQTFVVSVVGEMSNATESATAEETPVAQSAAAAEAPRAAQGQLLTRQDALDQLLKIAAFFRKTEPQSLMATSIEEVVRRGTLTLPDLVAELIPDDSARRVFFLNAGIKAK